MRRYSGSLVALMFLFTLPLAAQLGDLKSIYDSAKKKKAKPAAASADAASEKGRSGTAADGKLMIWVERNLGNMESPLHTELSINGKLVNAFTGDTFDSVDSYIQPGWNTVTLKTTAQDSAESHNDLIFRIGPAYRDTRNKKIVMSPVLWEWRNGTDWKLRDDGTYFHALGPDVKEVTQTLRLYYAGLETENRQIKAGDIILHGEGNFSSWNTPVTAMVYVNGTPLNSFTYNKRTIVITPYLKKGRNEIKVVSSRVDISVERNDVLFKVMGPAVWNVSQGKYELKPLLQFNGLQGWTADSRSGRLTNRTKPDAHTIERVIPLILKDDEGSE